MKPNQGIPADQIDQLFTQGCWAELEDIYSSRLKEDRSDARTAFYLANILAYQKKYSEALPHYEMAWTHRWPSVLPYNNKGVALACQGEARAAFDILTKACEADASCAPAFYNLGVLCIKLGNEGTLPQVLLDLGLGARDQKPGALARSYFEKADQGQWPEMDQHARPLLLWVADLQPGFGFEPAPQSAEIADAEVLFQQGLVLLRQEKWEDAIAKLKAAASLHLSFAPRIVPLCTAARIEIVRQRRAQAREIWEAGNHKGAAQVLDTLVGLGAELPNRAFAEEILAEGIQELARQIRGHKPSDGPDGWQALQRLITEARQRFEGAGYEPERPANEAETQGETTDSRDQRGAVPGVEGTDDPADSGARVLIMGSEDLSRSYLQQVCRRAWDEQIDHLVSTSAYDEAIQFLEFSEVQWFARADVPRWRRRVYTAHAESLRAQGWSSSKEGDWKEALDFWSRGRDAAIQAGDPHLTDTFESLITRLADSTSEARESAQKILKGSDDLEDLQLLMKELEGNPGDSRLVLRRNALIRQLLSQAEGALEAYQWQSARETAEAVLKVLPEESQALQILRKARQGLIGQWLAKAEHALSVTSLNEARDLCTQVLEIDPEQTRAREILREVETTSQRKVKAEAGPRPYDEAYLAYDEARNANDPDQAFEHVLRMRELDPRNRHTHQAFEWLCSTMVETLRSRLGRNRGTAQTLLPELQRLLDLRPDFKPARKLREELRRIAADRDYEDEKRQQTFGKLRKADEALVSNDPEAALDALKAIVRRDPDLEAEICTKRDEALNLLRRKIDNLMRELTDDRIGDVEQLLNVYKPWDQAFVAERRRELSRRKEEVKFEKQLDQDLKKNFPEAEQLKSDPIRGLRELDRELTRLELSGSDIRVRRESEIAAMRHAILESMPLLQRIWVRLRYAEMLRRLDQSTKEKK
jgi:tetratricopeptide (TPR) repeat protein